MPRWLNRHKWLLIITVALFALFLLAACEEEKKEATGTPVEGETPAAAEVEALAAIGFPESARVFLREALEQGIIDQFLFVDGTKSQTMFDDLGVANFEGMSGTAPGAGRTPEVSAKFDADYLARTGRSTAESAFVREGYDAMYLAALAAAAANSANSADIRDNLRFVANPPGEIIEPGADEFARALDLLAQGQDINYEGVSTAVDMDVNGDIARGTIEIWKIVSGKITTQEQRPLDLATETGIEVPAGSLKRADTAPTEPLKVGSIMSLTGDLSDFGQPVDDAIRMAADEINSAGGVWDQPVQVVTVDDATAPQQGQAAARQLIDVDGVSVIIGALSSGVTLPIAESVTSPSSILQISPASTSPALTEASDNDFLFRTPISDAAQGVILAQLADELGFKAVCTLFVNTPYGQGLSEVFANAFQDLGGTVPAQVPHEQEQASYVSELQRCVGG